MNKDFDNKNLIKHWIESSDNDFKTMEDLYQTKNNNWALFIGHLVIEKLLKALYLKKKDEFPPMIHDLRRISEKANVKIDTKMRIILDTISRFNIKPNLSGYKQREVLRF